MMLGADALAKRGPGPGPRPRPRPKVDPVLIARRCVQHVTAMAERCAEQNQKVADCCVAKIEELLAAGRVAEAEAQAKKCAQRITRISDSRVRIITHICKQTVRLLIKLEEPVLARRVNAACEAQIEVIRESQRVAMAQIRAALSAPA